MRKLTGKQFEKMDAWMQQRARPIDRAKWNYLFHGGSAEEIAAQILPYQNADGGLGHGFEPDLCLPLSAAIPTAEAIFLAYDYGLDCTASWFGAILAYFEQTVQDIPKYWEDCPRAAMDYPHAPWWTYAPCTVFNPNPCAVVASAFLRYGTVSQRSLGEQIAKDTLAFLTGTEFCGDHDTLNCMALVEQLIAIDSPLITEDVLSAMRRRIIENTCFDPGKWHQYYFCPLDFVSSPDSLWYDTIKTGITANLDFWLDTINADGIWTPNFSWGTDSDIARQVTEQWKGCVTVKRARILANFGLIER